MLLRPSLFRNSFVFFVEAYLSAHIFAQTETVICICEPLLEDPSHALYMPSSRIHGDKGCTVSANV